MEEGLKDDQDCDTCGHERLDEQNLYSWNIIMDIGPGLFNGFGGVDYGAIQFIFELYDVPMYRRREVFEKTIIYAEQVIEHNENKSH